MRVGVDRYINGHYKNKTKITTTNDTVLPCIVGSRVDALV